MNVFLRKPDADLREGLQFLEKAYHEGNTAAVPASLFPVLQRVGCHPSRGGFYLFPPPQMSRVAVCPLIDRVAAGLLLLLTGPFLAAVALSVLLCDGRPVFFIQQRTGSGGKPFRMLKFRTMRQVSAPVRDELIRNGRNDRVFKMVDDPRVTRLGQFLRKTFLDEWPQLINVLRGEMRLFGPRPLPASDHRLYRRSDQALRLIGMPGISGLWQVSERNRLTFDEMCLLDYYGLCHTSLVFNSWLALRTIRAVFQECGLKPRTGKNRGEPLDPQ